MAQEVKLLAHLSHPNVVKFYDNFVDNGVMHILMEFATGGTLYKQIVNREVRTGVTTGMTSRSRAACIQAWRLCLVGVAPTGSVVVVVVCGVRGRRLLLAAESDAPTCVPAVGQLHSNAWRYFVPVLSYRRARCLTKAKCGNSTSRLSWLSSTTVWAMTAL